MDKIYNYNCDGMCCEEFCSKRYTHSTRRTLHGMNIVLGFCEEHANEFENGPMG